MREDQLLFKSFQCIDPQDFWRYAPFAWWVALGLMLLAVHNVAILLLYRDPRNRSLRRLAVTTIYCTMIVCATTTALRAVTFNMEGPLIRLLGEPLIFAGSPFIAMTLVAAFFGRSLRWLREGGTFMSPPRNSFPTALLFIAAGLLALDVAVVVYLRGCYLEERFELPKEPHQISEWIFIHRRAFWYGALGLTAAFVTLRLNHRTAREFIKTAQRCMKCGYDLPTPLGRCPECGTSHA